MFWTVFWINILYVFHDIFKKYSFGGYLFFQKLEKYSFLFRYSFFLNFAFFSKSIRCWFIRLYRISNKNSFRRFWLFFLTALVWGLSVMIISSKSIRLEFMRFGIIFEKYPFAIFSFYTFFQKCIRFGLFVFSNE